MVVLENEYGGIDEDRVDGCMASWQVAEERIGGDGIWTTASLDNWYYLTDVMFSVRGIADRAGNMRPRVGSTALARPLLFTSQPSRGPRKRFERTRIG